MTRLPTTNNDPLDRITRIMPELALDDDEGDPFVGHFHRVSVPELMGREATSHAGFSGRVM
jgi:hypothetical protein